MPQKWGVADGFTLQCKLTPLWHLQISDTCWGWGSAAEVVVDGVHPSAVAGAMLLSTEDTTCFPPGGKYSRYSSQLRVQEWLLQLLHWTMPRVCCLNSFLTPEGTEAFLSLAQQLPLGSQCLPTYQPSRLQLFHMLRIWNFCGNRQISKCW